MFLKKNKCIDKSSKFKLSSLTMNAAFIGTNLWKPGEIIKIHFIDGSIYQQDYVKQVITNHLLPHINIRFKWDEDYDESDIKISFKIKNVAYSTIGIEAHNITDGETMNLGWLDDDEEYDDEHFKNTGAVIIHEFGHALGMIHEHQNPTKNPIEWNFTAIKSSMGGPPNYWTDEDIKRNIIEKYSIEQINGGEYDQYSIMHYFFPKKWILNKNLDIKYNTCLSPKDKEWLKKTYPKPTASIFPTIYYLLFILAYIITNLT